MHFREFLLKICLTSTVVAADSSPRAAIPQALLRRVPSTVHCSLVAKKVGTLVPGSVCGQEVSKCLCDLHNQGFVPTINYREEYRSLRSSILPLKRAQVLVISTAGTIPNA